VFEPGELVDCRVEEPALRIVEIAGERDIVHPVADMEMGDGRAEDMAGIMEGQFDIRCNIGYAPVVERDGMADIGLDLV
jgi:hypothetical protein